MTFHDFSVTKKIKIHDVSAQHIFLNKLYTTYECMLEIVVTVAAVRRTTVKKIKPGEVYLQIFQNSPSNTTLFAALELLLQLLFKNFSVQL